jgi:hypothetical protein
MGGQQALPLVQGLVVVEYWSSCTNLVVHLTVEAGVVLEVALVVHDQQVVVSWAGPGSLVPAAEALTVDDR